MAEFLGGFGRRLLHEKGLENKIDILPGNAGFGSKKIGLGWAVGKEGIESCNRAYVGAIGYASSRISNSLMEW